jgi:hypothetical protein
VNTIGKALDENRRTLHLVGRNDLHKYNNQGHAMMTLSPRRVITVTAPH